MRENKLTELQGTSILTKSFFNKLIRRIENVAESVAEGATGYSAITLNVCSGGTPAEIVVLGKTVEE
jgi:hypothetical protein